LFDKCVDVTSKSLESILVLDKIVETLLNSDGGSLSRSQENVSDLGYDAIHVIETFLRLNHQVQEVKLLSNRGIVFDVLDSLLNLLSEKFSCSFTVSVQCSCCWSKLSLEWVDGTDWALTKKAIHVRKGSFADLHLSFFGP